MNRDDEQYMKLGREIGRMIHDVHKVAGEDTGYARRKFTFPGGAVQIFVVNDERLADIFDTAAAVTHDVSNAIPPPERN